MLETYPRNGPESLGIVDPIDCQKMLRLVNPLPPQPDFTMFKPNPFRASTPPQPEGTDVDDAGSMEYRFEEKRLQSYQNWPSRVVSPVDLAAAGFYYTNQIDRVRCFECKTEVCCWEEGDDPMSEHQRWGGRCRFIRKLPCGNVPIGADPDSIPPPRPRGNDVCGPYGLEYRLGAGADTYTSMLEPRSVLEARSILDFETSMFDSSPISEPNTIFEATSSTSARHIKDQSLMSASRLGALGLAIAKKPDFPEYQSFESRLATFADWPASMPQTKEKLAEAGFFYGGRDDQTTCYHCGGGLKQWEQQDDPWVQHAKWFSTCLYVKVVKGQDFINSVVGKETPTLSQEEISMLNLPGYIRKVEPSAALEKREEKQQNRSEAEPSASSAGPSTSFPVPMPRTKLREPVPTPKVNVSKDSNEQQQQQQQQQQHAQPSPAEVQPEQPQVEEPETEKKPMDDARACKICYNEELGVVFLPCGHIVACVKCAPDMTTCAVCRKKVEMTVRAFFS